MNLVKSLLEMILLVVAWIGVTESYGGENIANMPQIQPKKSYVILSEKQGNELWETKGYGDQESKVRMMNLMMVEGSGYEGMEMEPMEMMSDSTNEECRCEDNPSE